MNKSRNINLDLMRFLGIVIIMIAHASPPEWLLQLRNFGTPLLIVASALTYALIYSERKIDTLSFYKKRLTRLIIPTWIFLTFFFVTFLAAAVFLQKDYPFSFKTILETYSFYGGIGFVWILKVYLILALLTPAALKINALKISNTKYFLALSMLYTAYEYVVNISNAYIPQGFDNFFNHVVFIIVPYSILYLYGMRLGSLSNKQITYVISCSLCLFLLLAYVKYIEAGHFVPTLGFKYPPTIYYLLYAFFALNSIYLVCKNLSGLSKNTYSIIVWLSSNSLWIYLWHIMGFYLWNYTIESPAGNFWWFILKVCFILGFGVFFTFLQKFIVNKTISKDHYIGRKVASILT